MNNRHHSSHVSVYAAAALLGVFYLSSSYAFFNVNHYKLLVAAVSGLILLFLAWQQRVAAAADATLRRPTLLLVLICLWPLLTTLPGLWISAGQFAYFLPQELSLWLLCSAWLLVLITVLDDVEKLRHFLLLLAVVVLAVAGLAIVTAVLEARTTGLVMRAAGTFGNPNYLACFLVMHIPLFSLYAMEPSSCGRSGRVLLVCTVLTSVVALLLTRSRMAWAALLLTLALLCALSILVPRFVPTTRKAGLMLVGCMLGAIALVALVFPDLLQTVTAELRATPASRLVPWQAALHSIADAPWFGWGAGSSYALFFQYVDPASRLLWHERSYAHVHNEVLEILQEGGVFGLLGYGVFLAVVGWTVIALLRNRSLSPLLRAVVTGIGSAVLIYHLAGLASVDTRMIVVRLALFTLLALLFSVWRLAANDKQLSASRLFTSTRSKQGNGCAQLLLVSAGLLLTSLALLKDDLESRYRYVQAMQQTDTALRERMLEDLRAEKPNVYAVEQLALTRLGRGDFVGTRQALATLEELIPHYGIGGYLQALSYYRQGDVLQARTAALAYQQRDRYFADNTRLLAQLALRDKDPALFLQQLQLLLTPLLSPAAGTWSLQGVHIPTVVIETTSQTTSCTVALATEAQANFMLALNEDELARWMQQLSTTLAAGFADQALADYPAPIIHVFDQLQCRGGDERLIATMRGGLLQVVISLVQPL